MEDDIFQHGKQGSAGVGGDNLTGSVNESACDGGGVVPKAQDLFTGKSDHCFP